MYNDYDIYIIIKYYYSRYDHVFKLDIIKLCMYNDYECSPSNFKNASITYMYGEGHVI